MARFSCRCGFRGTEAARQEHPTHAGIWRWACPECSRPVSAEYGSRERDLVSPETLAILARIHPESSNPSEWEFIF
jgi:hypothetical protein